MLTRTRIVRSWLYRSVLMPSAIVMASGMAQAQQADGGQSTGAFLDALSEPQIITDLPSEWVLPGLVTQGRLTIAVPSAALTSAGPDTGNVFVALFSRLAEDLGLTPSFVAEETEALVSGAAGQGFDLGCPAVTWTEELLLGGHVLTTSPITADLMVGVAPSGAGVSLADMTNLRVGALAGTAAATDDRTVFDSWAAMVSGFSAGTIDVGMMPLTALNADAGAFEIVAPVQAAMAQSLCISPGQPELVVAINVLLGNYRADGSLMALFAEKTGSTLGVELLNTIGYAAYGDAVAASPVVAAFLDEAPEVPRVSGVPQTWPMRNLVEAGKLTIANAANIPARFFTDAATGAFGGSYYTLISRIAEDLGLELVVERVAFAGQLPGLAANRFDMACTGTSWTPSRLATTDFLLTAPTGLNATVGLARSDGTVRSWDDGSRRPLGGVRGEIYLQSAQARVPDASDVLEFPGHLEGLLALLNRQTDLHAAHLWIALNTLETHPMRNRFAMVLPPLDIFAQSLCVNPRQGDLLMAVNTLLGIYRANGTWADIVGAHGERAEAELLRMIGY